MQRLGERQVNEVLGEAGINLHSALWAAGVVDELVLYQAPRLLGDAARGMLRLAPGELVDDMPQLDVRDISRFGDDLRIIARARRRSSHST